MKNIALKLLVITICVFSIVSCGKEKEATSPSEKLTVRSVAPETIIVCVNGKNIIQSDADKELQNILMQYQGKIPPEQLLQLKLQFKEQAVESLINKQLLFDEADKQNIQAEESEIESEIKRITAQFESPEKLKQQLKMMGVSEEKLRNDIKQNYRIEKLIKIKLPAVTITDEEAGQFYKENTESFTTPEQIQVSHILFSLSDNATDEIKKQKRQKLGAVLEQLKKGDDFGELARKHSDCPSKEQGGDLGSFPRGSMAKAFEDAAFSLKKGEVSNIVETQFGLHLIKLIERKETQTAPLDQVKEKISSYLETQKQNKEMTAYLDTLRAAAKIDYKEITKKN